MLRAKGDEPRVFFAWEKRRGLRALLARAPTRRGLVIAATVAAFLFLREREHVAAEVRATRAEIGSASTAVAAWRADHDLACPTSLGELVSSGHSTRRVGPSVANELPWPPRSKRIRRLERWARRRARRNGSGAMTTALGRERRICGIAATWPNVDDPRRRLGRSLIIQRKKQ